MWYNVDNMQEPKRIYRSNTNKIFGGVFGGVGEYFDIDPTILRVIFVFVLVFTGFVPGIVAYIIAMFVMPKKRLQ